MLTLTRRAGSGIVCVCPDGATVLVRVLRAVNDRGVVRVVLGVDAPRTVRIFREEVLRKEQERNAD